MLCVAYTPPCFLVSFAPGKENQWNLCSTIDREVCDRLRAQLLVLTGCVVPLPDGLISAMKSVFETSFFFVIAESLKEDSDFINNPM